MFSLGQRVKIINPGHSRAGQTVVIRAFRSFEDCPDLPPWPCYEALGLLWPVNPDWLRPAAASGQGRPGVAPLAVGGADAV